MTYDLEITRARHAQELRSGFIFVIRCGDRIACRGHIKPNGRTFFDSGSKPFPTALIACRMAFIADLYGSEGEIPEDLTFEDEPEEEPDAELEEDEPEEAPAPKPRAKRSKAKR